jgi:hypothetical protein
MTAGVLLFLWNGSSGHRAARALMRRQLRICSCFEDA